jgi:hypothetical protein
MNVRLKLSVYALDTLENVILTNVSPVNLISIKMTPLFHQPSSRLSARTTTFKLITNQRSSLLQNQLYVSKQQDYLPLKRSREISSS